MSKPKEQAAEYLMDIICKEIRNLDKLIWDISGENDPEDFEPLREQIDFIRGFLVKLQKSLAERLQRNPKPHAIMIVFGVDASHSADRIEYTKDDFESNLGSICEYRFTSIGELEAFLAGVEEGSGWNEYRTVKITAEGKVASN